jgi:hypothetical protein
VKTKKFRLNPKITKIYLVSVGKTALDLLDLTLLTKSIVMKAIKLFTTALLIGATSVAFAQKTKITKGDFSELKGQKEVNLEFDYAQAQARGGAPFANWKAQSEQDWLQQIVDKKNEKEAGTGDDWKKRWEAAKDGPFPSNFETKMAEMWKGTLVKRGLSDAKYTIRIKITYMDPGFSIGVSASDAYLSAIIEVVEGDNVTSSLTMDQIKGASAAKFIPGGAIAAAVDGATFERRLGESYEKMAKSLYAKVLKKALK